MVATNGTDTHEVNAGGVVALAFAAPMLVLGGALLRPWVSNFVDPDVVGAAAASSPDRWRVGTLAVALGLGLAAVLSWRCAGPERRGSMAALASLGGAIVVAHQLGASGYSLAGAADIGLDPAILIRAEAFWEIPLLSYGLVTLAFAWLPAARAVRRAGERTGASTAWVAPAALAAALGPLVPNSIGDLVAGAGLLALLPAAVRCSAPRVLPRHAIQPRSKTVTDGDQPRPEPRKTP